MSIYRIYEYPFADLPYKHVYIKRDRQGRGEEPRKTTAIENTRSILEKLGEYDRLDESVSRTKRMITDIALCNDFDYFCTFTMREDRYNYDLCRGKLTKFFNNFRVRNAPDFRYILVPEQHKNGAWHFHGLCAGFPPGELVVPDTILKRVSGELLQVPNTPRYEDWPRFASRFGWFNCSRVRSRQGVAFYIVKYVTKSLCVGKGRQAYMCSKGLKRPELVYDADSIPMPFVPTFQNDFCAVSFQREDVTDAYFGLKERPWWDGGHEEYIDDSYCFSVEHAEQLGW